MIFNEILKVISRRNSIIAFLIMLVATVIYTAFLPLEDSSQKAYNEFRADISGLSAEEIGERLDERVLELTIYDALLWGEPDSPDRGHTVGNVSPEDSGGRLAAITDDAVASVRRQALDLPRLLPFFGSKAHDRKQGHHHFKNQNQGKHP